jgi:hypothetical protein
MPWQVKQDPRCPSGKPWAVVLEGDGSVVACHPNEIMAKRHQAALYANNPEAREPQPVAKR